MTPEEEENDFREWLSRHDEELRISAAESGADRELDFDSEQYAEDRYHAFIQEPCTLCWWREGFHCYAEPCERDERGRSSKAARNRCGKFVPVAGGIRAIQAETSRKYIKKEDCKRGWLYRIRSRNAGLGIYAPGVGGFVILRHKDGITQLSVEKHWDDGAPYGTARPSVAIEEVSEMVIMKLEAGAELEEPHVYAYFQSLFPHVLRRRG